jgi:hypothetical protein
MATLILSAAALGLGGYIGYAGGHIRHKEFRFEPPPGQAQPEQQGSGDP